ncbi:hypothetical protein BDZ94DRAFT_1245193 [Collybia nuda]|uniref:DNA replication factor Cdt1 C-terminal domain-containing protein n=1 Tax=Collybia nuda TaxID=64659 RepID=A0A9P6CQH3_9AGAR|nr:hypothetical protein BDZ94DRAFT_1245193 [Collybia nuda]
MSNIYTALQVSPRKKRCPPAFDDESIVTPKKLRTAPPTPPPTSHHAANQELPLHLARLYTIQTSLQHALSHALATCAVSPASDTGVVRNVLNHLSLTTYTGLTTQFEMDDLRKLCWIWEWDAKTFPSSQIPIKDTKDEDNPFLDKTPSPPTSEWTRGSMGLVLSPTTHYSKKDRKRVPAYGIGIEVEMDIDKDMKGGMAAVARWTSATEARRSEFRDKLEHWVKLHRGRFPIPDVPHADLPQLTMPMKISSLTRSLASSSPKAVLPFSSKLIPSSPNTSPSKSPAKRVAEFAIPFPIAPSALKSPSKSSISFPKTPSRHDKHDHTKGLTPRTPASSLASDCIFNPITPVHQRGNSASTVPQTPTTSRRQALYERIRQRSLTTSPTKASSSEVKGGKLTRDQMLKMGQDEMRRRCLLGRLDGVAESVWMLFSTPPAGSSATPTTRKRRALPTSEVALAVVKSSPVPISTAEANESLSILAKLCPFFIKERNIAGAEWLEMPAAKAVTSALGMEGSPTKKKPTAPPSPGAVKERYESAEELITRSPRRVRREAGGLREVREIIRRELELQD